KAKEGAKEQKNHNHLYSIYYIMAHTFAGLDQYDSAFYYFNKHQNLSLNFMNNPKTIEAYQAYISTFLESSENKLTIAQQEIALKNRQFAVLVIVAVAVILLVMLLLIIAQQKRRIKDNENKKLSRQLEHEKEIQRLEKEKQEETIAAKTREITSYSLQLSNKNVILKQIMDLSSQLSSATPKEVVEINKKINAIIKSNYNLDNDWKSFKIHFDKVHPRFFDKLKEHAPGLTENNLRICAYFRIGMSNKQIAQILNISPESVIIHRHRLKKKLNLTDEENLDDFIRAL
ncbi:MAG: helix-turn-helix transcriptional regulator, partial [Bacteroidales bacterium]|nr:helix-turn-helix transcriptional regulator [Bacteroidales bacterium]